MTELNNWIESCQYKGYDPYDILNSPLDFKLFGKWGPALAVQFQKRNPVNIRPLLGIKKGHNPKGLGLLLKAYCLLYAHSKERRYLKKADWLFQWLDANYSQGYSGKCWGYNFDWANPGGNLPAYTPSVVVTSFVVDGLFEYFKLTGSQEAKEAVTSAANYIIHDIPVTELSEGVSFSYTHLSRGCCYNASLLAAEVLAKADMLLRTEDYGQKTEGREQWTEDCGQTMESGGQEHHSRVNQAIDFVLAQQKAGGEWWYSFDPDTGRERRQIDFHQGFVLVSLHNLNQLIRKPRSDVQAAIARGLAFYKEHQFLPSGQALWRLPKNWPVDIHNQSQGIITFARLKEYHRDYLKFARTIAQWTITHMQDKTGYFYYRKYPMFTNKIPYMRWSQAWMMLALSELIQSE